MTTIMRLVSDEYEVGWIMIIRVDHNYVTGFSVMGRIMIR